MDSSSVSHFSLSTSDFDGAFDALNVSDGVEGGEELHGSGGLFEGDNGVVGNHQRDLWNPLDPVATSKHKSSGG